MLRGMVVVWQLTMVLVWVGAKQLSSAGDFVLAAVLCSCCALCWTVKRRHLDLLP
jgi:hypothetical protein